MPVSRRQTIVISSSFFPSPSDIITSLSASMISRLCISTQPADELTTKWLSFPYLSIIIPESLSPSLFINLYAFVLPPFFVSNTFSLNICASCIRFFTTRLIKIGDSVSFANSNILTRNMLLELYAPHPTGLKLWSNTPTACPFSGLFSVESIAPPYTSGFPSIKMFALPLANFTEGIPLSMAFFNSAERPYISETCSSVSNRLELLRMFRRVIL